MERIPDFPGFDNLLALVAFVKDPDATAKWLEEAQAVIKRNEVVLRDIATAKELKACRKLAKDLEKREAALKQGQDTLKAEVENTRSALREERAKMLKDVDKLKAQAKEKLSVAEVEADRILRHAGVKARRSR